MGVIDISILREGCFMVAPLNAILGLKSPTITLLPQICGFITIKTPHRLVA